MKSKEVMKKVKSDSTLEPRKQEMVISPQPEYEDLEELEKELKKCLADPRMSPSWSIGTLEGDGFFGDDESTQEDDLDGSKSPEPSEMLDKLYISELKEILRKIDNELKQLKEKRENIDRRAAELSQSKDKQPRKNWYHLFGSPYFKDKSFFPCPGNEDFYEKISKNEINYHELPPIHRWKRGDQSRLETAVRHNLIDIAKKKLKATKEMILKKFKVGNLTQEEEESLLTELDDNEQMEENVENMSTTKLLQNNEKDLDWLRISVVDFDGQRSSEEIQAMWELCLHPTICRKSWTDAESKRLEEIATKYNIEDWDKIAKELNTNRSSFQCFVQYQRNLNKNLRKSKWTEEEDIMLKKIIQECRVGDYIPWSKVALRMHGRTKVQVYNRWTYSINPMIRKGRFTPEEDCLIVAGVQRFGKDFARIAQFLPGRTSIQIRDRFIGSLHKVGPIGKWTREEDKLLLELVEKYGTKSWSRIVSHFSGRYRSQVRHRYLTLRRWMAKYPELSVQYAPSRYHGEYCNRQANIWSQVRSVLRSSLKKPDLGIEEEDVRDDSLLILKKKLNMVNPKRCGRKAGSRKPLTEAEMKLMEHVKSNHILRCGRKKFNFDEEYHQRRKSTVGLLFDLLKVRLAFPFDNKVIEDDDTLDTADKFVLLNLKRIYDARTMGRSSVTSSLNNGGTVNRWIPLNFPEVTPIFPMAGDIPPSVGTVLGLRTALAVKSRLAEYQNSPKEKVIALPAWRPPNLGPGEERVKRISPEESEKLFSERLLILFRWTYHLTQVKPQIHGDVFAKNLEAPINKGGTLTQPLTVAASKNCIHVVKKVTSNKSLLRAKKKQSSEEQGKQRKRKEKPNVEGCKTSVKEPKESKAKKRKITTDENVPRRRSARLSNGNDSGTNTS
ncbi:snRNA-activating protein complex subunit 4 homolog [Ischnura elegans]|uniref:snRNA-activating protein complex subunit 4 homolog n=1 Tax=Ischnura elegans TaxID=197161 RepID=UPI001ED86F79|nr:snRNA-activating protein complex subunit 4 homolog [Ischnura elegans]